MIHFISANQTPCLAKAALNLTFLASALGLATDANAECKLKNPNLGFFSGTETRTYNFDGNQLKTVEDIWEKRCKPFIEETIAKWDQHPERTTWQKPVEISMQCRGSAVCDIYMVWNVQDNTLQVVKDQGATSAPKAPSAAQPAQTPN